MADATQDFAAKITYLNDWTAHLTAAGKTITSATVVATSGTVTGVSNTTTGVTFRLDTTALPTTTALSSVVTVTATLNNGDVDVRHYTIQVTNT